MKQKIFFLIIFIMFLNILYAQPALNSAAQSHYDKGVKEYNKNRFDSAILEFNRAISIFGQYADAYLMRGNCYDNKNNPEKALENYIQASEYNKKYLIFAYGYECALEHIKKYDDAIITLSRSIELGINSFIAHCMRGNSYSSKGDILKAIEDYDEAIKINPKIFQPYFSRGSQHIKLENFDEAIKDYEISIKLYPDFYLAYYALSFLYYMIGDFDKAQEMMMIYKVNDEKVDI